MRDLCAGRDPYERIYSQTLMRDHLTFWNEIFPSRERTRVSERIGHTLSFNLFCLCRMPDMSKQMVCCDFCETWYSVPIPNDVIQDEDDLLTWMCCVYNYMYMYDSHFCNLGSYMSIYLSLCSLGSTCVIKNVHSSFYVMIFCSYQTE